MAFESKTERQQEQQFIGFHVTEEQASHLKLIALDNDMFLNSVMRGMVIDYLKTKPKIKKLIDDLANKAINEWDTLFKRKHMTTGWTKWESVTKHWNTFIKRTEKNLLRRKISRDITDIIINKIINIELERK